MGLKELHDRLAGFCLYMRRQTQNEPIPGHVPAQSEEFHSQSFRAEPRSVTILAKLRSFELILRWARSAASRLTSKWTSLFSTVKFMTPPIAANPSLSPTVRVLDPVRLRTILSAWSFSVLGINTMWQALNVSAGLGFRTWTGWPHAFRVRTSP